MRGGICVICGPSGEVRGRKCVVGERLRSKAYRDRGDGNEKGRPFADLMDSGLLWLINSSVFHPRGVALSLHVDRETGAAVGWSLITAAPGEAMRYAVPAELDDPAKAPDLDAAYRAAEATLAAARNAP